MNLRFAYLALTAIITTFIGPDPAAISESARTLLHDTDPAKTSYRHKNTSVLWKTEDHPAECYADCSALVSAILKHACNITDSQLSNWLGRKRPLARDYYDTIHATRGFKTIADPKDIHPGDIIAFKYPASAKDTGHCMIADGEATERTATEPLIENTKQWELPIIDSTGSSHGKGDTRRDAEGKTRSGLGRGTIRLYTTDNKIVGYTWSTGPKSMYRPATERAIAVGRLNITDPAPWLKAHTAEPEKRDDGDGKPEATDSAAR